MADVMTQQLVQSLKGYFKKDEFSDKILRIIEIDESFESSTKFDHSITKSPKRKLEADISDSPTSSAKKLKLNANKEDDDDDEDDDVLVILPSVKANSVLSSTPIVKKKIKKSYTPTGPCSSQSIEPLVSYITASRTEPQDEKKLFENLSFAISKLVDSLISRKITEFGGTVTTMKHCDYIISTYANSSRRKCDTRERTVKWLLDSIRDNELKASFLDVLYRPVQVKSKPLHGCILSFDQYTKDEKDSLQKLTDCLGASTQELVFSKQQKNQSVVASTHVILKKGEGLQYDTAQLWEIPCVTEDWILKCVETQSKYSEAEFLVQTAVNAEKNDTMEAQDNFDMPAPYSVFPVHSLILCINSPYFKTLISGSGMIETKQKEIVVKVSVGEGKYLELLIHSFYDQDILKDMEPLDLLKVLEIADRFLCDVFIKRGLVMLKKLNIKSVDQCNVILDHILTFETMGSLSAGETYTSMKQFCSKFLADLFLPLESKIDKHELFEEMTFDSLNLLLQSGRQFLWSENSLVYFIVNWLAADEERQTEDNIKTVLTEVRYEQMSPEFLRDVLSPNHTILSKWKEYVKWYIDALSYHALSHKSRRQRDYPQARKNRSICNYKTDIQHCMIKLSYISGGIFKQSWVNYRNIVFQGYVLMPKVIITEADEEDKFKVKLHFFLGSSCKEKVVERFYFELDIAFAILPGSENYESSELFTHSSSTFINKHYRPLKIKFDKKNLDKKPAGTVDGKLFEKFKGHGMYAAFAFKSADINSWPTFMKAFQNLSYNGPLHRKNTQSFGQHELL